MRIACAFAQSHNEMEVALDKEEHLYNQCIAHVRLKDYKTHDAQVLHASLLFESCHEIMVLFVLRKLILQTRMRSNPVALYV